MSDAEMIDIDEMAAMHKVDRHTIHRILLADQKRPENERRIPGAVKLGSRYRGEWKIPRAVAENWKRDGRGRKPSKDNADQREAEQDFKDGWKAAMNDEVIPASDLKGFLDDDD